MQDSEEPASQRLTERQRDVIQSALRDVPEVAAGWVFGSFARGDAGPSSDLDVAVVLEEPVDTARLGRLLGDLASRLERAAPGRAIDVIVLENQGPIFQHQVLAEGILLYDKNPKRRIDVESTAYVRYLDFRPTYDLAATHAREGFLRWLREQP